jgi:hypothetical protein
MKEQQRIDPELAWVVRWRETGEEPTEGELFLGDSRSKYYWINREVLCSLYIFGTTLLADFSSSPSLHRTPFSKTKTSLFIQ